MPHILIHSFTTDIHSNAVMWALDQLGASYTFWPSDLFPRESCWSMEFKPGKNNARYSVAVNEESFELSEYKTAWYRRPKRPKISTNVHEDDQTFLEQECLPHMRSMARLISPGALWVNTPDSATKDLYKPLQIQMAASSGFNIPHTLFSNEPEEIRSFYNRLQGNVIYKSYRSSYWANAGTATGKVAMGYTSTLYPADLASDDTLRAGPGIFQEKIEKAYEVRVTVMGKSYMAAKILSQENEATKEDWRLNYDLLKIERTLIPTAIEQSCLTYMEKAGLNFGCFDFIVTPDGEYYFLEVNQMGQFLWKEEMGSNMPLLQMFCDFLISGDPNFKWQEKKPKLSFLNYLNHLEATNTPSYKTSA